MKHNYLVLNSESGWETGVSLHSCARAVVSTNKIESPEDQARIWHVNTGLMLSENVATQLNLIELTGLRIGVKITNKLQVWSPISWQYYQHCFKGCWLGRVVVSLYP